jgi:hypothetical protein
MRANLHSYYRNSREDLLRHHQSKFNREALGPEDEAKLETLDAARRRMTEQTRAQQLS